MALKEKVERFIMFPFSVGCVSQSSVRVVENQPMNTPIEQHFTPQDEERTEEYVRTKSSSSFLQLPMPNLSSGIHKLAKRFKNISNLFSIYKNIEEEDDVEMEIGYPTDVQHVSHIGWDGFNSAGGIKKRWEKGEEFFPLSSLSLKQFELAMAPQAQSSGAL